MNYPTRILPQRAYKSIDCDLSSHYLIRFTNSSHVSEITDPETGFVKAEFIFSPKKHGSDLSTSLLGIFEISHTRIELTESGKRIYNEYCLPDCEVDVPMYEKDFQVNTSRNFWVILIEKIKDAKITFNKGDLPFEAECFIQHTPMKWNYWHFSIRWKTDEGFWHELSEKKQEKITKRIGHDVRAFISKFATTKEPNYSEIEEEFYLK